MLTAYGATVVTLMMIFYAFEARSPWFTFAFAISSNCAIPSRRSGRGGIARQA